MESYGSALDRRESQTEKTSPTCYKRPNHSRSSSTASSRHSKQNVSKDWEVMEDAQVEIQTTETLQDIIAAPGICEGYLLKRRRWPLKGWHKRYFVLQAGILRYSKSQQDISRGKVQGSLDVSMAVMSVNKKSNRIDLDAGHVIYHMKVKSHELFYIWLTKLQAHRIYKRNEAAQVHNGCLQILNHGSVGGQLARRNGDLNTTGIYRAEVLPSAVSGVNGKVSAWLQQTHDTDSCAQELNRCQMDLSELNRLVQRLQTLETGPVFSNGDLQRIISMQNLSLEKPKKSKSGKIWSQSRTLSRVEARMLSSSHLSSPSHLGTSSSPSVPDFAQASPPTVTSPEGKKIHQDICTVSLRVHTSLKSVHDILAQEHQRQHEGWSSNNVHRSKTLAQAGAATRQSQEDPPTAVDSDDGEYFDASDDVLGGSSSDGSYESRLSDGTTSNSEPDAGHDSATRKYRASISKAPNSVVPKSTGHRTTLPAHCPDNSHVGLMQILYNNIGKDLSRVSMPAALNEPINLLQRLCEELEYQELLDTACNTQDPFQRMVYIAAFAISGYSTATFRNRYKPFNPVLGETYEYTSEEPDRRLRLICEQVCHHPPISACHADSDNFSFWQDQRWKNKFWGKSLEICPTGMVNVTLPKHGDHYEWNKVVTCIHNVLSQQRYLEHYGEVTIRNLNNNVCTCKITFVKSRYWGSDTNKNEVQGTVLDRTGSVIHRFGGLWHEGIFCDTLPTPQCIWKPNPQPEDDLLYFGFSSFALEMNELTPDLKPFLPPTDTRMRPDQRFLEEGRLDDTDIKKDEVEEMQRERRKEMIKRGEDHVPRFFKKAKDSSSRDVWLTNGTYWKLRESPGFANIENMALW